MEHIKKEIEQKELEARKKTIIERIIGWVEDSDTVEITETPKMKRSGIILTDPMKSTGELEVTINLTGLDLDEYVKLLPGSKDEELNTSWTIGKL